MSLHDITKTKGSRAFRAAVSDPALGRIHEVFDFDPSSAIQNVDRPVFVVSCYSDRSRQIGTVFDEFVLLVQNSYVLGFVNNLATAWLFHSHREPVDITAFSVGFAKKFVGEQLYRLAPSEISRVLFMESVLAFERDWRVPIEAKADDEELKTSSDALTRLTNHFMLHHEIGHIASVDERFDPFVRERVDLYLEHHDHSDLTQYSVKVLREEAEADLFGLCSTIAEFAPIMTEERLRSYLHFVTRAVTLLNILYVMADDLHRVNVQPDFPVDIDEAFSLWAHREKLMSAFVTSFPINQTTVEAASSDSLLSMSDASVLFEKLVDPERLVEPVDPHGRRFVQVVNLGFENGSSFGDVIEGTRVQWVLGHQDKEQ